VKQGARTQLISQRRTFFTLDAADQDVRTLGDKLPDACFSDPLGAAGNQGHF